MDKATLTNAKACVLFHPETNEVMASFTKILMGDGRYSINAVSGPLQKFFECRDVELPYCLGQVAEWVFNAFIKYEYGDEISVAEMVIDRVFTENTGGGCLITFVEFSEFAPGAIANKALSISDETCALVDSSDDVLSGEMEFPEIEYVLYDGREYGDSMKESPTKILKSFEFDEEDEIFKVNFKELGSLSVSMDGEIVDYSMVNLD